MPTEEDYSQLLSNAYMGAVDTAAYYPSKLFLLSTYIENSDDDSVDVRLHAVSPAQLDLLLEFSNRCRMAIRGLCIYLQVVFKLHEWQQQRWLASALEQRVFGAFRVDHFNCHTPSQVVSLIQQWIDGDIPAKHLSSVFWESVGSLVEDVTDMMHVVWVSGNNGPHNVLGKVFEIALNMLCSFVIPVRSMLSGKGTLGNFAYDSFRTLRDVNRWSSTLANYRHVIGRLTYECDSDASYVSLLNEDRVFGFEMSQPLRLNEERMLALAMSQHLRLGGGSSSVRVLAPDMLRLVLEPTRRAWPILRYLTHELGETEQQRIRETKWGDDKGSNFRQVFNIPTRVRRRRSS